MASCSAPGFRFLELACFSAFSSCKQRWAGQPVCLFRKVLRREAAGAEAPAGPASSIPHSREAVLRAGLALHTLKHRPPSCSHGSGWCFHHGGSIFVALRIVCVLCTSSAWMPGAPVPGRAGGGLRARLWPPGRTLGLRLAAGSRSLHLRFLFREGAAEGGVLRTRPTHTELRKGHGLCPKEMGALSCTLPCLLPKPASLLC